MITRSGILREVLEEKGRQLMKYSKHGACLLPVEGYEKLFEDLNEECRLLREMINENATREAGRVKPAQWQKDLMDGKEPDMSWTGAAEEKIEEYTQPDSWSKDYIWNPFTQTWEDPDNVPERLTHNGKNYVYDPLRKVYTEEYTGKHAKPESVVYPGGE